MTNTAASGAETTLPDQPDEIDEESRDLPDPIRAAERVRAYIANCGDGLYDVVGGTPLYARDLEALTRAALTADPEGDRLTEVRADRDRIVAASDHLMGQLRAEVERLSAGVSAA